MTVFHPAQCSEREPGGWEDCPWCSGVMLNNAAHGRNVVPSTRSEYEALRVAGGDGPAEHSGDGSNLAQVQVGIRRRYGWTPARFGPPNLSRVPFGAFWDMLDPGMGAVVNGSMGAWLGSSHWNRWDRGFRGPHSVYVSRDIAAPEVNWQNPLAPSTYPGEVMPKRELQRFYEAFAGGFLIAKVGMLALPDTSEEDMAFSIPQYPSIATAVRDTKLYLTSGLTGTGFAVSKGHTKRYIGHPSGDDETAIIGHDRSPDLDGKSALFGRAVDWDVRVAP